MAESPLRPAPAWVVAAAQVIHRLPAGRYRAMNWVGRRKVDPFWARLPMDLGALLYRCDLRDGLMREVCLTGRYEPQETVLLQHVLRAGMTFVDVGANWGYFTLAAAHLVGASGRVVSVEADPRACRTLSANVARNTLSHVRVCELAASDGPGSLWFQEYQHNAGDFGNFGVAQTSTVVAAGRRFQVTAHALDDVLDDAGVGHVDLLKMDIEGAEARALVGLRRRLAAHAVDRILLEVHPYHLRDLGSSPARVVDELGGHGYRAWRIDHSRSAHRRAARGTVDVSAILTPLEEARELGDWPHLLWTRDELFA